MNRTSLLKKLGTLVECRSCKHVAPPERGPAHIIVGAPLRGRPSSHLHHHSNHGGTPTRYRLKAVSNVDQSFSIVRLPAEKITIPFGLARRAASIARVSFSGGQNPGGRSRRN